MSLSYDSCQSHFTSYSNFQEFIDTKNFFVNVVKLLLLVIFIKFPIFKDILKVTIVHIIQINNQPSLSDLERINYIINSSASFSSDKKPEIVVKQLFPEKFPENTSFTRKKLNNYEEFSIPVHIERMIDIEDKDKEVGDNKPNESINPPNNETSSLSRSISVGYATLEIA
ncbi:3633_t:CDS:2, partial [Funneliformis geosporum]